MSPRDAASLVPLKPNWFHILLSLAEGPRHGYAVMQEVRDRTDDKVRLWPTQLYGSIRRMEDEGMVESVPGEPDVDDERRQYYALTEFGRDVLREDTRRLESLVQLARSRTV